MMAVDGAPRVMQVLLNLQPGGAEQLVVDLALRIATSLPTVVCCLDESGPLQTPLAARGIPVMVLGRRRGFRPSLGHRLAAVAREHDVDVLHCHHYTPFVYGQIAALVRPSLGIVFTDHGRFAEYAGPSIKRRLVNPLLSRLPGICVAVSGALGADMVRDGFPAGRIRVIHNGIESGPPVTPDDRIEARRRLALPPDAFVLGTAARLDPVKDLATQINALAIIRRHVPSACLVIVGDGPCRAELERRARALCLSDAVVFAGYQRDARALLPAFDVYVNSSLYEGVSLTLLEAMAASLPIVASTVGGTPEVVVAGETGLLVAPRAVRSLAAAVQELVPESRRRVLGAAGRQRVERHFTMERMAADYLQAYRASVRAGSRMARRSAAWEGRV